jgi:hypothetical protein
MKRIITVVLSGAFMPYFGDGLFRYILLYLLIDTYGAKNPYFTLLSAFIGE